MSSSIVKPLMEEKITTSPNGTVKNVTVEEATALLDKLQANIRSVVVIASETLRLILVAILGQGHLLLEDVPVLARH